MMINANIGNAGTMRDEQKTIVILNEDESILLEIHQYINGSQERGDSYKYVTAVAKTMRINYT